MATYPIRLRRKYKAGRNPYKRQEAIKYNKMVDIIENYLNEKIEENGAETQLYIYGFIASDLGLRVEDVRDILFELDCGHTGLTVVKRQNM